MATISKKAPNRTVTGSGFSNSPTWYNPVVPLYTAPNNIQPQPFPTQTIQPQPFPSGTPSASNVIDLVARYQKDNIIQARSGDYYKVVGAVGSVKNNKGLTRVKGKDGKTYYMKRLSKSEIKSLDKKTVQPRIGNSPTSNGPVAQQPPAAGQVPASPLPGAGTSHRTEGYAVKNPDGSVTNSYADDPNRGYTKTDDWWTSDWWNRPGYYKRMY